MPAAGAVIGGGGKRRASPENPARGPAGFGRIGREKRSLRKEKLVGKYKLNKKVVVISSLDETDEKDYWKSRTPTDRLKAVEINRRIVYGYARTSPRFQSF